jgi:hypothetical protein
MNKKTPILYWTSYAEQFLFRSFVSMDARYPWTNAAAVLTYVNGEPMDGEMKIYVNSKEMKPGDTIYDVHKIKIGCEDQMGQWYDYLLPGNRYWKRCSYAGPDGRFLPCRRCAGNGQMENIPNCIPGVTPGHPTQKEILQRPGNYSIEAVFTPSLFWRKQGWGKATLYGHSNLHVVKGGPEGPCRNSVGYEYDREWTFPWAPPLMLPTCWSSTYGFSKCTGFGIGSNPKIPIKAPVILN